MNPLYHITLPTWPQALHSFRSGIEVLEIPYALAFIDALLAQHDAHPGRFHDAAQGLEAVGGLAYLEDLDEECIEGLVVNMPDNWTLLMRPWRDIWEVSVLGMQNGSEFQSRTGGPGTRGRRPSGGSPFCEFLIPSVYRVSKPSTRTSEKYCSETVLWCSLPSCGVVSCSVLPHITRYYMLPVLDMLLKGPP